MYALPEQTLAEAEATSRTALAARTPHLSVYHLTLEPNTLFHRHPPPLPDDDAAAAMQDMIEERLAGAGYVHYETSAYARPGARVPAQSQLLALRRLPRHRRRRALEAVVSRPHRAPDALQAAARVPGARRGRRRRCRRSTRSQRSDLGFEFMMNALRLTEGFDGGAVRRAHRAAACGRRPAARSSAKRRV